MKKINVVCPVNQPSIFEYNNGHKNMACEGKNLESVFEILTDPENINKALIFTELTGSSPVSFYGDQLQVAINSKMIEDLSPREKQIVGTVVCNIMENNGWSKTGKKQRYRKGIFSTGELYINS